MPPLETHAGTGAGSSYVGMPNKDFVVEYITTQEGVINLCEEWNELESCFNTPLLASEWFQSSAQAFCPPDFLKMISVRFDGKLSAIIPLSVKGKLMPRAELVGSSTLEEPGGVLYKDRGSLVKLVRALLDLRMPIFLKGFRFSSPEIQILENELRAKRMVSLIREERIPWVAIRGKWEIFEKQISSSRRSSLRCLQRLAESRGKVRFEAICPTPENLDEYLDEVFRVEAANWKGRNGTAMKTGTMLGKFFKLYSRKAAEQKKLHLFFLKVDEKNVAVQLTVKHANSLWIYKIGHDEEWSWCSPGILLMHQVVKFCFEKGLKGCEFLGSDEPWLHIWANESHSLVTYRIYSKSAKGILELWWDLGQTYFFGIASLLRRKMVQKKPSKSRSGKVTKG